MRLRVWRCIGQRVCIGPTVCIFHCGCVSPTQERNAAGENCYEVYLVAPDVKGYGRERVKIWIR